DRGKIGVPRIGHPGGPKPGRPRGAKNRAPLGLAAYVRDQTLDGRELADFHLSILRGHVPGAPKKEQPRLRDRMEAADWLADRAFGRPSHQDPWPGSESGQGFLLPTVDALPEEDKVLVGQAFSILYRARLREPGGFDSGGGTPTA